jgi:hypothetical protein
LAQVHKRDGVLVFKHFGAGNIASSQLAKDTNTRGRRVDEMGHGHILRKKTSQERLKLWLVF